jgi:ABC-2 type transport system ATP-binding protein
MDEAERLCDRIAIIDNGRTVALGRADELKRTVGADTVVSVRADRDPERLADVLRQELSGVTSARLVDGGVEVHLAASAQLAAQVVHAVESAGLALADLSVSEPSLETVFIELTGKDLREK